MDSNKGNQTTVILWTLITGAAAGLIGGCLICLIATGVISIAHPERYREFWRWMLTGMGVGIGGALGFTILNALVASFDTTKSRAGL